MNVDPRGMTVMNWAECMILPLSRLAPTVARLLRAEDWEEWALGLVQNSQIARFNPPDPRHYTKWEDWALQFNLVVPT